jgi:hypothetical protein
MFRFKDGTTPDQIDAITTGLASLPAEIDVIKVYLFGSDAGLTEGSWDYGLSGTFAHDADYALYTRIRPIPR